MADTLKFGPEWLRQLSSGGSMTSPPPSPSFGGKYKLAEYRYGREEMLSLFTPNPKAPDDLKQFTSILIERCLDPMAMIAPTEEEQRLLSSNVNSNAVFRQVMSRGSTDRGPPGMRGTGRGVISSRGRGRGRGEPTTYFQRGGFDDPLQSRGDTLRGRGGREGGVTKVIERDSSGSLSARSFDESSDRRSKDPFSRSVPGDRWSELRTTSRESGTRLGTPPESNTDDSNLTGLGGGEEPSEDWRRAGKDRQPRGNWRDSKASFDDEPSSRYQRGGGGFGFNRQMSYERSRPQRQDEDEMLPEWAVDDMGGGDESGTFDASGAFMSLKDASADKPNTTPQQNGDTAKRTKKQEATMARKALPPLTIKQETQSATTGGGSTPSASLGAGGKPGTPVSVQTPKLRTDSRSQSPFTDTSSNQTTTHTSGGGAEALVPPPSASSRVPPPADKPVISSGECSAKATDQPEADFDHLTKAAEEMMATWAAEDDDQPPPPISQQQQQQQQRQPQLLQQQQQQQQHPQLLQQQQQQQQLSNSNDGIGVEQLDATGVDGLTPPELADHWFYKDPQGTLQGPFSAQEMAEWFSAGYFTMTLLVKQGRDRVFQPLGEIIKRCGNVQPFVPSTPVPVGLPVSAGVHNPLGGVDSTVIASAVAAVPQDPIAIQQQHLFILQQQQVLLQQQQQMQQLIRQQQQQQLNQIVETLRASKEYATLSTQQLQTIAMNILVKEQQKQQQQQAMIAQQARVILEANGRNRISPVNQSSPPQQPSAVNHKMTTTPSATPTPTPHDEDTLWGAANRSWQQQLKERQAVDEIAQKEAARQQEQQRAELERIQLFEEQRRNEQKRLQEEKAKEEIRRQREEMERQQREMEEKKRQEIERQEQEKMRQKEKQVELERQRELERQQILQIERQKEIDRKIQLEAKKKAQLERQREEEERCHKEAMAAELAHRQEQQQDEIERVERSRQAAERERERERQAERDRLENLQLPSTAQWASGNSTAQGSTFNKRQHSIQEIQRTEKEQAERAREAKAEADRQRQLELLEQNQQQTQLKWAAPSASKSQSPVTVGKSLREIQEEEARRLEKEQREQKAAASTAAASTSVATPGSSWGSSRPTGGGWASEGAWGNAVKKGTWEQPKPSKSTNSDVFPSLSAAATASSKSQNNSSHAGNQSQSKKKQSNVSAQGGSVGSKKSAAAQNDKVQKLFQNAMQQGDDKFSEWCVKSLEGLNSSIDVPTFVTFLRDIESPYEVQDYIKSYVGETAKSNQFAKEFLERRSAANKQRQARQRLEEEESLWGPAPAVNPAAAQRTSDNTGFINTSAAAAAERKKKSAKKTKGQKMDATALLGFTVGASSHRLNIGEIEKAE